MDAAAIYRALRATETPAAHADPFAAHVLACALTVAIIDADEICDSVGAAIGLDRSNLTALIGDWLPAAAALICLTAQPEQVMRDEEESQLFGLLGRFLVDAAPTTNRIAGVVTRRAMAPRHLWQDLGLRNRDELSQLLARWFPALAADNVDNMKWKKFFYRRLCELEGFTLCAAPTCRECGDFDACFGEESGESVLARRSR